MTLSSLLETLADNEMLNIQIKDSTDKILIEFEAPGYESLSAELLAMTVSKVVIDSYLSVTSQITIILSDN